MKQPMSRTRLDDLARIAAAAKLGRGTVHWSELADAVDEIERLREQIDRMTASYRPIPPLPVMTD